MVITSPKEDASVEEAGAEDAAVAGGAAAVAEEVTGHTQVVVICPGMARMMSGKRSGSAGAHKRLCVSGECGRAMTLLGSTSSMADATPAGGF